MSRSTASRDASAAHRSRQSAVLWSSPLFDRTGFAEEARNHILALDQAGVPVYLRPLSWKWHTQLPAWSADRLNELIAIAAPAGFVHVVHSTAPTFHRHPLASRHIGRTMRETEGLPAQWVSKCNEMDEVWVPSEFNLETFAVAGVEANKLYKIPECLQLELYDPDVPPLGLSGASGFVFLSVFGWTRRKGWDVLVRAYLDEFDADEDVTLALKINPYLGKSVTQGVAELEAFIRGELGRDPARSARLVVINVDPGAEGMPRLYRAANAFVMPTRGEGWGRPYMEAMAMGLPTIGTRWGGNLEFMTEENSYLVECELADVSEAAWQERPLLRGHRWAEPSVEHLRSVMRRVFERRDEAEEKGRRARDHVRAHYGWEQVAAAIIEQLGGVEAAPAQRSRIVVTQKAPHDEDRVKPSPVIPYPAGWDADQAWYARIIAATCAFYPNAVYVEIGVDQGHAVQIVASSCGDVHGVDVNPGSRDAMPPGSRFWEMPSDRFFSVYDGPAPHVIFIDGDHRYEQAARDFRNSLRLLAPGGTIFLHDTWPTNPGETSPHLCGTVCQLLPEISERPELESFTWAGYPGLTAVRRRGDARDRPHPER
jgi:glycosyltransferase involved in cell wall biosynthesis